MAASQVVIQNVNLETDVVTITNQASVPQDMTGWTLESEVGGQVFPFPDGYVLAAGGTVRITSGLGSYSNPPAVLEWLKADGTPYLAYVWNNSGDPAVLYDDEGSVVSTFP